MPTYATIAQFKAGAPQYAALGDDAISALLDSAEIDVDDAVGARRVLSNGRKFDPAALTTVQATGLQRATIAQAAYRELMGPKFFATGQYKSVQGPDFKTDGSLPVFGPQAYRELKASKLMRLSATWGERHYDAPPWAGFAQG